MLARNSFRPPVFHCASFRYCQYIPVSCFGHLQYQILSKLGNKFKKCGKTVCMALKQIVALITSTSTTVTAAQQHYVQIYSDFSRIGKK